MTSTLIWRDHLFTSKTFILCANWSWDCCLRDIWSSINKHTGHKITVILSSHHLGLYVMRTAPWLLLRNSKLEIIIQWLCRSHRGVMGSPEASEGWESTRDRHKGEHNKRSWPSLSWGKAFLMSTWGAYCRSLLLPAEEPPFCSHTSDKMVVQTGTHPPRHQRSSAA